MRYYRVSGLIIASQITLSHLHEQPDLEGASVDVFITRDDLSDFSPDWPTYLNSPNEDVQNLHFRIEDDFRILVSHGRKIVVDCPVSKPDAEIALFIVGLSWGTICHQRGLLPLHCSSILHDGGAYAFTGVSGAGKSTLLYGLKQRGYSVCTDYLMITLPGFPPKAYEMRVGIKLWEDAIDYFGAQTNEQLRLRDNRRKFRVALNQERADSLRDLQAMYILCEAEAGTQPKITPLQGVTSWMELYNSVYRIDMVPWLRPAEPIARQVEALSRSLPLYEFSRPKDMNQYETGLDLIEAHIAELSQQSGQPSSSQNGVTA